jgi:phenylacetate-CoA ligase
MKRIGVDKSDMAMTLTPQGMSVMSYCMVQQYSAIGAGVIPFGVGRPDEILDAIVDLPVSIVISLPIALARLAEYGVARRGAVASGRLRQLHCGGDFLSDAQRQRLETSWGVPCFNFYGLSEVFGPIAGECLYKNGMHFLHDYVYVEVLDPVTRVPVAEGQPGVAVYTTLWAKGSPVVRYWSDDYVRVDYAPCPCGDQSPRLHFIGRPLAMLENAGRRVFARELEEQILRFSVSSEYALNVLASDSAALTVEVLPDHDFDPVELRKCIEDLIGMKLELNLVNVGTLPRIAPKPQRIIHDPTPRG